MSVQSQKQAYQSSYWDKFKEQISQFGILMVILVLGLVFSVTSEHFLTLPNLQNILKQISITGVLGIGMTMVILIGGIDLSVGSVVLFSAVVMNTLIVDEVFPTWICVLIGLLASAGLGALNGFLIIRFKIAPVIATLGTMIMVRGLAQIILWINNSWLWVKDPMFMYIKTGEIGYIPVTAFIMIALYIVAIFIMRNTPFGRKIYAVGGNIVGANLCGVPVNRIKMYVYMASAFCAGIGGILVSARLSAVSPGVGNNMEFQAITAVVLGGTSLSGGVGKVGKTILGAIAVGMILNYMTIMGISAHYQQAATGFLILMAVLIDRMSKGKLGE